MTENKGDLISREALKHEIMDNMYFIREEVIAVIKVSNLLKLIDNAPAVLVNNAVKII